MGARGPRKKPSALEELQGRPGKRKINRLEPKLGGNLFDPPRWMTKDQRAEWRYIVENSVPGLLTSVDRANLRAYVVATCLHRQAARELAKAKSLTVAVGTAGALQQHPVLQIVNRQALIMIKAAAEMAFTPASRSRVSVGGEVSPTNGQPVDQPSAPTHGSLAAYVQAKRHTLAIRLRLVHPALRGLFRLGVTSLRPRPAAEFPFLQRRNQRRAARRGDLAGIGHRPPPMRSMGARRSPARRSRPGRAPAVAAVSGVWVQRWFSFAMPLPYWEVARFEVKYAWCGSEQSYAEPQRRARYSVVFHLLIGKKQRSATCRTYASPP